jgi:hypothetical protein
MVRGGRMKGKAMNRKNVVGLAAVLCMVGSVASAETPELESELDADLNPLLSAPLPEAEWGASAEFIRPNNDLDWDAAFGVTLKYTRWLSDTRGVALSAGIQRWLVNEDIYSTGYDVGGGFGAGYAGGLAGDARMFPLSIGLVNLTRLAPHWDLRVELGVSYVVIDSNVQWVEAAALARGTQLVATDSFTSDVDIDNNLLAVATMDLHYRSQPDDPISFFAGLGAQFDLVKGDFSYPATPLSGALTYDNELRGLQFRFGVAGLY